MKNTIAIFLMLGALASCSPSPSSKKIADGTDKIKKVETHLLNEVYFEGDPTWTIEERMAHYGVPGVGIAVIHNGEVAWAKSYGVTDKESQAPVTDKTLFQAASISKPVTAYGALRLVEQQKVDLEKDINAYLESWKLPENEFTAEKKVTLKNLLNHSAGITVHGFLGYSPGLPVPSLVQVLNGTPPANSRAIFVDKLPEESFRYSGGGYNIVQQMMIDVEGQTFPEIMEKLVLKPLGMNQSTYDQPLKAEQLKLAATGYLPDGSMTKGKRHTYPEMAPAGLWTTAEDIARFAVNIQKTLKGENTNGLSQEMTTTMLSPFVERFIGLGIFLEDRKGETYFNHGGWNEGFSSKMIAHRDNGYGVVVMTNSNHPAFIDEVIRAVALTYEWENYNPIHKEFNKGMNQTDEYVGKYKVNGNEVMEIFLEAGKLYSKGLLVEPQELIPVSDSSYIRRERNRLIVFKPGAEQGEMNMLFLDPVGGSLRGTISRMKAGETIPLEYLVKGDFDQSLKAYQALMEKDPKDPTVNENNLNLLGYGFLNNGELKAAQDVFKVNMLLYPESSNVYDSYAEACMKIGEDALAIENYKKSIRLDPGNNNAKEMIKKLRK